MATSGVKGRSEALFSPGVSPYVEFSKPEPNQYAYAEGDGIKGGECGKWLTFLVKNVGSPIQGVVRLYLEYADDAAFRSYAFINDVSDERDMLRSVPSCFNKRLANNSVADSIAHTFIWDVCVVAKDAYNVRYRVNRPGSYMLHIKLNGNNIPGSPLRIFISDAPPITAANRIYGPNVRCCKALPYVPKIAETLFPGSSESRKDASSFEHTALGENISSMSNDSSGKNCRLKTDVTYSDDALCQQASPTRQKDADGKPQKVLHEDQGHTANSDGAIRHLMRICSYEGQNGRQGITPSVELFTPKKRGSSSSFDQNVKSSVGHRKRTLQYLERFKLLNEIEVHLVDANGNAVTHGKPCIRAWGENYARVVSLDYKGKGVISIKYVVIVPRDGINKIKEMQTRGFHSSLPSSIKDGGAPCKISVEVDGKPVFGSPFYPSVDNIPEIENYYIEEKHPMEDVIKQFEHLLNNDDFDACLQLYNSNDDVKIKEKLTSILLENLTVLDGKNIATAGDIRLVNSLKLQSLGKILELVKSQYQKMLKYKTDNIVNSIRELKTFQEEPKPSKDEEGKTPSQRKEFNNLGDVILNYRLIGDELRKLHRYDLADKFDKVNDRMCDEIDLGMWTSTMKQKESRVAQLRKEVQEAYNRINEFSDRMKGKYSKAQRENLDDFKNKPGFAFDRGVQTDEPHDITTKLGPLIQNRCTPPNKANNVDLIVQSHWRNCNNYDIQATITKVLKSAPRLKNCLSELFAYYSTSHFKDGDRSVTGVSRASMELFVIEARLNKYLISNENKLQWLFEKFSKELSATKGDSTSSTEETKKTRVIQEHFWCAFLRELAYLNILYTIAESGDKEILRDTQHPSRLVAFYHLCNEHLTPLYGHLFSTKPEFQKCLKFPDYNTLSRSKTSAKTAKKAAEAPKEHYFGSRADIIKYFNAKAIENVLQALNLDVLQMIFKHYSRLSMYGKGKVPNGWFDDNCTISVSTFVVFARDFQIIPGHIHRESVMDIAKSVIRKSPNRSDNKLTLQEFINAVARTVAKTVLGACLARHDAYDSSTNNRDSNTSLSEGTPATIHSKESVITEIDMLLQSLGLCDSQLAKFTIDAIYGPEALDFL